MNDKLRELGAVLESRSDELWELQNAALQLTVEGAERQVVATATSVLTTLRDELATRGYQRLVATIDDHLRELAAEELQPEALTSLFDLVEALGATARGVSSKKIASLVNGDDDPHDEDRRQHESDEARPSDATSEPEQPAEETGGDQLVDSFADLDPEEIEEFCAESHEHIQIIELNLVELERTGSPENVNEVFRAAHSIKGGAQYLGLEATATVSHRMETMLDRIRSGVLTTTPAVMAALLKGLDCLAALTRAAEKQQESEVDVTAVVRSMDALLDAPPPAEPVPPALEPVPPAAPEPAGPDEKEPVEVEADEAEKDEEETVLEAEGEGSEAAPAPGAPDRSELQLFADDYSANMASVRSLMAEADSVLRDADQAAVLTRNLHTIRGIAGFVGLGSMEELANGLEALMSSLRRAGSGVPEHVREPVAEALAALDSIFEQYVEHGVSDIDIDPLVHTITELAGQESAAATTTVRPNGMALAFAESDHPLAARFSELLAAHDQGRTDDLAELLVQLEDGAVLHGFEQLAAAAHELAERHELPHEQMSIEIERLADLVPQQLDAAVTPAGDPAGHEEPFEELLLSVPGIGPKKRDRIIEAGLDSCAAVVDGGMEALLGIRGINVDQARMVLSRCGVREPGPTAQRPDPLSTELTRLMLEDDHDRELVGIYLETTAARVAATIAYLDDGQTDPASEAVTDMASAASYMGYDSLSSVFETVRGLLQAAAPDTDTAADELHKVAEVLAQIAAFQAKADAGEGEQQAVEAETEELERIFSDSAREHLQALSHAFTRFVGGMTPELLASLQHHLTCLESTATNIGNDPVADMARDLRSRIEGLWIEPETLSRAAATEVMADITTLFKRCRLEPPEIGLPPVVAVVTAETRRAMAGPPPVLEASAVGEEETVEQMLVSAIDELAASDSAPVATVPAVQAAETHLEETAEPSVPAPSPPSTDVPGGPGDGDGGEPPGGDGGGGDDDGGEQPRGLVEPQATLRVDTEKIDDLMNMAAELVVNRSSLMVLGAALREVVTRVIDSGVVSRTVTSDLRSLVNRFDEETNDLGRVSNQLQEGVMRMRMVPVKVLFSRVPRLVRDLAHRAKRAVRVTFSGEETELDKTVIEQLSDPLVHLIRNAVGHGIESPQQRRAAGKNAEGHLSIAARHEGNMVILEVEDDGRGIDREQVRERLVATGASSSTDAARLSDRELLAAIFLPGFSTAQQVSDVSGRGVGLDVVKSNIESLGGQVEVFSEPGRWCRFAIRIPLTMAIMQALLVKVEDEVYSIPVSSVIQTVKLSPDEISTVENQEVITVRDQVIPLIRVDEVFTYNYHVETGQLGRHHKHNGNNGNNGNSAHNGHGGNGGEHVAEEEAYVVVLQGDDTEIGVVVDSVIGGQDIVIKSLEDELVDARGIAGGAILGDGTVTLILDVAEIQKMAIDSEHFQRRRLSDAMRRIERYLAERGPGSIGPQPS